MVRWSGTSGRRIPRAPGRTEEAQDPDPVAGNSLAPWLRITGITVVSPHPGVVVTPLVGGLTAATNAVAPIRHLLPNFFEAFFRDAGRHRGQACIVAGAREQALAKLGDQVQVALAIAEAAGLNAPDVAAQAATAC